MRPFDADRLGKLLILNSCQGSMFGSDSISMMVASDSYEEAGSEHIQIGTSQKSGAGRPQIIDLTPVRRHLASISH